MRSIFRACNYVLDNVHLGLLYYIIVADKRASKHGRSTFGKVYHLTIGVLAELRTMYMAYAKVWPSRPMPEYSSLTSPTIILRHFMLKVFANPIEPSPNHPFVVMS